MLMAKDHCRMDQDGTLTISYDEWRDFLLLAPTTDIHDLIKFWRHSTVSSRSEALLGAKMNEPESVYVMSGKLRSWAI